MADLSITNDTELEFYLRTVQCVLHVTTILNDQYPNTLLEGESITPEQLGLEEGVELKIGLEVRRQCPQVLIWGSYKDN